MSGKAIEHPGDDHIRGDDERGLLRVRPMLEAPASHIPHKLAAEPVSRLLQLFGPLIALFSCSS
jgi:hypothetical protein